MSQRWHRLRRYLRPNQPTIVAPFARQQEIIASGIPRDHLPSGWKYREGSGLGGKALPMMEYRTRTNTSSGDIDLHTCTLASVRARVRLSVHACICPCVLASMHPASIRCPSVHRLVRVCVRPCIRPCLHRPEDAAEG